MKCQKCEHQRFRNSRLCRACLKKRNDEIVRLRHYENFTIFELRDRFDVTHFAISSVLQEAARRERQRMTQTSSWNTGLLPCRLKKEDWPKCYGQSCYHARRGTCESFNRTGTAVGANGHASGHMDRNSMAFCR